MVVFHVNWDLHSFGFTRSDPGLSLPWWLFGRMIAACFLALSGLGLVLAQRSRADWHHAVRRIGSIAGSACAVSAATWLVAPEQTVWFGILHCIAMCNALALPVLRTRIWVAPILAVSAIALPWILGGALPNWMWWTGLAAQVPDTLDYQPLFPSLGFVLLGVSFGENGGMERLRQVRIGRDALTRLVCAVGRRSLLVYLLHQPLLFAVLLGVTTLVRPPGTVEADKGGFVGKCVSGCEVKGSDHDLCTTACRCVQRRILRGSGPMGRDLEASAQACMPDATHPSSP